MPRFYAHFQQLSGPDPDCTLIVELPHAATVAQLTEECCRRYRAIAQHRAGIDPSKLQVTVAGRWQPLRSEDTLAQRVKNGADVVLAPLGGVSTGPEALPELPQAAAQRNVVQPSPGVLESLQQYLEDSTKAMQAKNFRGATEMHEKIFEIDPTNMQACYQQALVELSIGAYTRASATLERSLTASPPPQEQEIYLKLGEAYDGQGGAQNYQTALQHYDTALGLASASAAHDADRADSIKILMAKTLQKAGSAEVAWQLVTSVLQRNDQHTEALILYAETIFERYATLSRCSALCGARLTARSCCAEDIAMRHCECIFGCSCHKLKTR